MLARGTDIGLTVTIMGYAVRTDRYRYVEWQDWKTKEIVARELYDHDSDAVESKNLAAQPQHSETIEELSRVLQRGWTSAIPLQEKTG